MFTGIIEEIGSVESINKRSMSERIRIRCNRVLEHTRVGDSIAVCGVCLTVTSMDDGGFTADVMEETVKRSTLRILKVGDPVNLERAMSSDGRFGGHMVAGHVDGIGNIVSVKKQEMGIIYRIKPENPHLFRYIVEKGSVALDGISLTVASVDDKEFTVSVIPHTIVQTTLKVKSSGDLVNIETDIMGKYVEKARGAEEQSGSDGRGLSGRLSGDFAAGEAFLRENGF
ncbi:MAG: riboflavin synthase [Eubacterium sp.]|nr:riboflavin synthase [Eubacterium sp.]